MSRGAGRFQHVQYLWSDAAAGKLGGVDRLVYRSNALGSDLTLTNTGGGNTSSKLVEKDPLDGHDVEVLWVKGSGGDLRTTKRDGFASLYIDKIRAMKRRYLDAPERGPKTRVEDRMYELYSHCVFGLNPRACSIDTPLHTFVPRKHVDHLHPNAVIAIEDSIMQPSITFIPCARATAIMSSASVMPPHFMSLMLMPSKAPARGGMSAARCTLSSA